MSIDKGLAVADMTGCTSGVTDHLAYRWATNSYCPKSTVDFRHQGCYRTRNEVSFRMNEKLSFCLKVQFQGHQTFVRIVPAWDSQSISSYAMLNFTNELSVVPPLSTILQWRRWKKQKKRLVFLASLCQTIYDWNRYSERRLHHLSLPNRGWACGIRHYIARPSSFARSQCTYLQHSRTEDATITKTDANGHFDAQLKRLCGWHKTLYASI